MLDLSTRRLLCGLSLLALAATACSSGGSSSSKGEPAAPTEVVLATHSSWSVPDEVLAAFTAKTGQKVTVLPNGGAGELTNKLVLTKDAPLADAVYGIDNSFASRAVEEGVLDDYRSAALPRGKYDLPGAGSAQLTPVDWADVCVNVDDAWFARNNKTAPTTLDDLLDPAYKGLMVTPAATTSSPGFSFLLTMVAKYGEAGWQDYWTALLANGTKVTSSWSDAFEVDYTAGGGKGTRPIVLSYNSSPAFTVDDAKTTSTTHALLGTCSRQVEYAGVLRGGKNPTGAQALIDFMASAEFQKALPDNMYVLPVAEGTPLPTEWATFAPPAPAPFTVDPATITAKRADWLRAWGDIVAS